MPRREFWSRCFGGGVFWWAGKRLLRLKPGRRGCGGAAVELPHVTVTGLLVQQQKQGGERQDSQCVDLNLVGTHDPPR